MVTKYCPKCNKEKETSFFYKNRKRGDGLQSWCKTCLDEKSKKYDKSEINKRYRELHKKEANAASKKYYSTKHGAEKRRQYFLSDSYKVIKQRWEQSQQGRESRQARHERRRAAEKNCVSTLTLSEWREVVLGYGEMCIYCGKRNAKLTQEHVVPLSKGGEHTKENVVPACQECNTSKNNNTLILWLVKQKG